MNHHLYILRLPDNRLYVGISRNPKQRLVYHRQSKGAKYTKHCDDINLVYTERFDNLIVAMNREKQIKSWTRAKKEALISGNTDLLKRL